MMNWREVNWAEVLVQSIVFVVIAVVVLVLFGMWVQKANSRSEARIVGIQQEFLRSEYARLASESVIYQDELRGLIQEVAQMAKAVRTAVQSPDWDPEEHLDALAVFEERIESLGEPIGP